jgi:hypothetical protein
MTKRALSVTNLLLKKRELIAFDGPWAASFGEPELGSVWLVWGNSGHGKTRLVLQLCRYLADQYPIAYNSLEEGDSKSMADAFRQVGMDEVARRVVLLDKEPLPELANRLRKHKSARIAVIDSSQYAGWTYAQYRAFRDEFRNKMIIITSHADGREPAGKVARSIRFDCDVKVRVEGYRAFPVSRYGGGQAYDIWSEGIKNYWTINQN